MEEELSEKRQTVESFAGETLARPNDLKNYINSLRGKSNTYKKKKGELSEYRAEYGVLSRTLELLQSKSERLQQSLSNLESERGISGFRDTKSNLAAVDATASGLDEQKGQTLDEMSGLVHQLTMKIGERKTRLAPIIKELRPLRQQVQEKEAEFDEKKHQFDALTLQLESSMSRVEQEVRKFQEEVLANETKHHMLELKNRHVELLLQRAQEEIKLYVSKGEDRKKSVRELLLKQVRAALSVVRAIFRASTELPEIFVEKGAKSFQNSQSIEFFVKKKSFRMAEVAHLFGVQRTLDECYSLLCWIALIR